MTDNKQNNQNKRMIKNTLFLYFRMILTLSMTLYTSRLVLAALGVNDYGIPNVVAGAVTMFAFMSGSMSSATQRFLSYEQGKTKDNRTNDIFKMSLNIYVIIFFIVIIIAETAGLWFINNKLTIPLDRLYAANWAYQCAIISFGFTMIGIPYLASIISNEKMIAFAYISIFEVSFKLIAVIILGANLGDNLIVYSVLLAIISALVWCLYYFFCRFQLSNTTYSFYWDDILFKKLLGFSGWNLIGNLSLIGMNQGVNILLNIFFGPAINATRAISSQVDIAIRGFSSNLQMSMNPLIIKSYASKEYEYMHLLVFKGAKYSFFLLLFLTLPVLIKTEFILTLWLGTLPDKLIIFCQLALIDSLIVSLSGTLVTAAQANGNIKYYQIFTGGVLLLNVPLSYLFFTLGAKPEVAIMVMIMVSITALVVRLLFLKKMINLSIKKYFQIVLSKIFIVSLICIPTMFYISHLMDKTFIDFLIQCTASSLLLIITIWSFGLDVSERKFIKEKVHSTLSKFKV